MNGTKSRLLRVAGVGIALSSSIGCSGQSDSNAAPTASQLIHLDVELARAEVTSAPAPASAREKRTWNFAEPQTEWHALSSETYPSLADVEFQPIDGCTRLSLAASAGPRRGRGLLVGGILVDVPEAPLDAWTGLLVRARSHARMGGISAACNVDSPDSLPNSFAFFGAGEGTSPVFNDGSVQDYLLALTVREEEEEEDATSAEPREPAREKRATIHNLALFAGAPQPASLEILSITLVPRGASFLEASGVRSLTRDGITRRTVFAHAPARIAFTVRVPDAGRLDLGFSCSQGESITYRTTVRPAPTRSTASRTSGELTVLASDTIRDPHAWLQRSLDLSAWSGQEVELALEASSDTPGAVALWGAPILSSFSGLSSAPRATPAVAAADASGTSTRSTSKKSSTNATAAAAPASKTSASTSSGARRAPASRPNVIFYVIDGGGADLMSVYGYNRRTTPFLERLAAEDGVVFEHAYSNSTWTQPSTASFMTSLHHSVLGGLRRGMHSTPVPHNATTMAEHMHGAGYQTAVFTSNPNCARVIGLERGVDFMRDADTEDSATSSEELHADFWRYRDDYPGHPFWVHFQTTDVHQPNHPSTPFAGLFVTPEDRAKVEQWDGQLFQHAGELFGTTSIGAWYDIALERTKIDRTSYFNLRRGLYDETMAHQDRELERFVERLKLEGEWENTLLVIGADHGHPAGTFSRFGRGLIEPQPEGWQGGLFDAYCTRVPLIFVWPRGIEGGRRIDQAVSMIDVLPTILDLTGVPLPDVLQGRSLAPLLHGEEMERRPVIFDEFRVDEASGQMVGNIEVLDGRFGASLEVAPTADGADGSQGRHAYPAGGRWGAVHPYFADASRLLLYDLWADPFATRAVNEEHPELVERYRGILTAQWDAHRALAQRLGDAGDRALDPAMVRQLEALGYTR